MHRLVQNINQFTNKVGQGVSWISLILVILIGMDVVLRYAFNWSSSANQELEWHLFAALFLLGAAYALKHDKHVRVDVFYSQFSATQKAWVNLVGTLVFLIPFCTVIIQTSIPFVIDAWKISESSAEPGGLPYRFIIKSTIPASAILLLTQAISEGLSALATILNREAR
ncbi:TRAP transporter small permease subunit [Reichenbachiella carrageenanivorans]|uniref:TRAP transporter small permease subunit n=1 Tax=Reichenbachiella carrageenanivorans TaxID=2979869 RepID=A0ABY6D3Q9_9BACT|nr:TRAP transporter small permease subunit [Reichenbachiella carrageenanivorans]UXX80792.1 TRAP transporter small permease subunit [Reichenbachiella carrageenanivorans]